MKKTSQKEAALDKKSIRQLNRSSILQAAQVVETLIPRVVVSQDGKTKETFEATAQECATDLVAQIRAAASGNLSGLETILLTQIQVLDRLWLDNMRRYKDAALADHAKWYLEKALQAQDQCRAAIASLISLRAINPQNKKKSGNDTVG